MSIPDLTPSLERVSADLRRHVRAALASLPDAAPLYGADARYAEELELRLRQVLAVVGQLLRGDGERS